VEKKSRTQVKEKRSATEVAYARLKNEILTNRLAPGDSISIDDYVRALKLSRTPLREAILRLQREGLIEIRPRQGTFVAPLDLRQIQDLLAVRRLLEGEAARLAAPRISRESLDDLSRQWKDGTDPFELFNCSQRVHALCAQHCGNLMLRQMLENSQDHYIRFRSLTPRSPERLLSYHKEHISIVAALKAKDAAKAQERMHSHLDRASAYLLDSLLNRVDTGPRLTITLHELAVP